MNPPSPELCRGCGHRFPPGAPDPSWCPACGNLCGALDQPPERLPEEPEEVRQTPAEWARTRRWFWRLFLLGPAVAIIMALTAPRLARLASSGPLGVVNASATAVLSLLGTLVCCAVGAAYFLTATWDRPLTGRERAGHVALFTILILVVQGVVTLVALALLVPAARKWF